MSTSNIIPEGYIIIDGPDDQKYVVPEFMVPALHQVFDGYRKKLDLDAFRRAGAVSGEAGYTRRPMLLFTITNFFLSLGSRKQQS
jgi:hypothetical protein